MLAISSKLSIENLPWLKSPNDYSPSQKKRSHECSRDLFEESRLIT